METALDIATWVFLMAGSFFLLVAGIGILRLPDIFTRLHAAGIGDTMGAGLILTGLMFQGGLSAVTVRLVAVLFFLWYTSPIATHALSKAALHGKVEPILHDRPGDGS